jgi:hypothetical protein
VESRSSIRQVQGFTEPSAGLDHTATLDIKDDSSPIEYSRLFLVYFFGHIIIGGIKSALPSVLHPAST